MFDRYKKMNEMIQKTVNHALKPRKKDFLSRTKNTIHPKMYNKACKMLFEKYMGNDKAKLKHYFLKWKAQCKN